MVQKTEGIVTATIRAGKCLDAKLDNSIKDFARKSNINVVSVSKDADGYTLIGVTYGPVLGAREYDVRKKFQASLVKTNNTGAEVTYNSSRTVFRTRSAAEIASAPRRAKK